MNSDAVFFSLVLAATLLAVLLSAIRLFRAGRQVLAIAFFAFAIACSFLSTLYWIAYDLLRGDARMPFAANEICEWAQFLLLASCLRAVFPRRPIRLRAVVPAALFAAANTALWIAWSGEWMQDILTGLSFGWFLCVLIDCLTTSGALSRAEWTALGIAAGLLISAQVMTFLVPAAAVQLELACSALLFAAEAWLILKAAFSLKGGRAAWRDLCLFFASYAWSTVAMYMSSGAVYLAALVLATLCYPMMLLALRKEVTAA